MKGQGSEERARRGKDPIQSRPTELVFSIKENLKNGESKKESAVDRKRIG